MTGVIEYCSRCKPGKPNHSANMERKHRAEEKQTSLISVHDLYGRVHHLFLYEMSRIYEEALEKRETVANCIQL
jgi:hypothetical protein